MTKRGGARPGAGRPAGAVSKVKLELAYKAQDYSDMALETLVGICQNSESDASRVSAANAILDRGYGKPHQAVALSAELDIKTDKRSDREVAREVAFLLTKGQRESQQSNS